MKRFFFALLVSLISVHASWGQIEADSVKLNQLIKEGDTLIAKNKNAEAEAKYDSAVMISEQLKDWEKYFQCTGYMIETIWRQYRLKDAAILADSALNHVNTYLDSASYEEGFITFHLANINQVAGQFEIAMETYEKAIRILQKDDEESLRALASCYANKGILHSRLGQLVEEHQCYLEADGIQRKLYGDDDILIVNNINNIAVSYALRGESALSIRYFEDALRILKLNKQNGPLYNRVLKNLGTLYVDMRQYQKGLNYQHQALSNWLKTNSDTNLDVVTYYLPIGEALTKMTLYDSASYYFEKVLQFEDQLKTSNPALLWTVYNLHFANQSGMGNYEKSINGMEDLIAKLQLEQPDNYYQLSIFYQILANIYKGKEDFELAEKMMTKSLMVSKKIKETQVLQTFYSLYVLAEFSFKQGKKQQALDYIEESLDFLYPNLKVGELEIPPIGESNNEILASSALGLKLEVLTELYLEDKADVDREFLQKMFDDLDLRLGILRKSTYKQEDKQRFNKVFNDFFELGVKYYQALYQRENDQKYLERCYYFISGAKSSLLTDALNSTDAMKWSGVPEELITLESNIKNGLSFQKSQLNKAKNTNDTTLIKESESKLFRLNVALDSLTTVLEQNYADYYRIKYAGNRSDIKSIQERLDDSSLICDYFLSEYGKYVFFISKDQSDLVQIADTVNFNSTVINFASLIDQFRMIDDINNEDQIGTLGHQLYTTLLGQFADEIQLESKDKLIIIPDGELGYFPFELLLTEPVNQTVINYAAYPYLIKKYDISYAYSSDLLFDDKTRSDAITTDFLSYAPAYENVSDQQVALRSLGKFRDAFVDLEWNGEEAEAIGTYFKSDAKIGKQATERSFKEKAKDAQVLHLAMHAFVDDEDPMNSKLVFYQDQDSIEDGFLHTFELYNMRLNAEMAVLSACETGYGKLVNGEGIISLARGFAYAGVPSVVMSHWQVDDQSTKEIMEKFYQYLSEGQTKSSALRQAKLSYLESAPATKKHPFFWSAFVVIGDDQPIASEMNGIYVWLIISVVAIVIVFVFLRVRKGRQTV
ncbi:MAG: CHAT domain-containing tetratricopeptide repeat protein [Bacteroidota bacterium]